MFCRWRMLRPRVGGTWWGHTTGTRRTLHLTPAQQQSSQQPPAKKLHFWQQAVRVAVAGTVPMFVVANLFFGWKDYAVVKSMVAHRSKARQYAVKGLPGPTLLARDHLISSLEDVKKLKTVLNGPEVAVHQLSLMAFLCTLRPGYMLEMWEAHLRYHLGVMMLAAGEVEASSKELWTSRRLWNHVSIIGTAIDEVGRLENEHGRAIIRCGDHRARFTTFDKALAECLAAESVLPADRFLHARVLNNLAVARFAEGLDQTALADMADAAQRADDIVKPLLNLGAQDVQAFNEAWSKRTSRKPSDVQHIRIVTDAMERDEVHTATALSPVFFSEARHHVRFESVDRARVVLRKSLTARTNLIHMSACAGEGTVDHIHTLVKKANGQFTRLSPLYCGLDQTWLAHGGGARVLLAIGVGLVGALERKEVPDIQRTKVEKLATRCFTLALKDAPQHTAPSNKSYHRRLFGLTWRARLRCATGNTALGLDDAREATDLFRRLTPPAGTTLVDSPRDVRVAALAYMTLAEHGDSELRERNLDAALKLVKARRALQERNEVIAMHDHPVTIQVARIRRGRPLRAAPKQVPLALDAVEEFVKGITKSSKGRGWEAPLRARNHKLM